jgi:hypothetical protein
LFVEMDGEERGEETRGLWACRGGEGEREDALEEMVDEDELEEGERWKLAWWFSVEMCARGEEVAAAVGEEEEQDDQF